MVWSMVDVWGGFGTGPEVFDTGPEEFEGSVVGVWIGFDIDMGPEVFGAMGRDRESVAMIN
jgi:hypothetical protein